MSAILRIATICLVFSSTAGAFEFTTTLPAPTGTTPTIDGERSQGEWDDAVRVELLGGGELYLKHDDAYLYVLIVSKRKGIASVCVERENGIAVLHASAALGTAEYEGHGRGTRLRRSFLFELRDTGTSLEAKRARKSFLHEELWFANTARRGSPVRELQISLEMTKQHGRIPMAVTWFAFDEGLVAYWPEDLSDDCLNLELIKGNTPKNLDFESHRWPVVTIETVGPPPGDR